MRIACSLVAGLFLSRVSIVPAFAQGADRPVPSDRSETALVTLSGEISVEGVFRDADFTSARPSVDLPDWLGAPRLRSAAGEVRPASGDVDADGRGEIVAGPGPFPGSGGWHPDFGWWFLGFGPLLGGGESAAPPVAAEPDRSLLDEMQNPGAGPSAGPEGSVDHTTLEPSHGSGPGCEGPP